MLNGDSPRNDGALGTAGEVGWEGPDPTRTASRPRSMPRPNFFLVGAAKCGTTSLHAYLRQHRDVFMSEPKEPRFFDTDMPSHPRWCVRDAARYEALFAGAGGYRVIGEASPSYLVSEVAPKRVREYSPDARVLVSLRNPVDFMYSLHRQFVGTCNEDLHDFAEALAAEPDRARGERIPPDAHYPRQLLYRHNARFAEQLERWYDAFGAERVKVVLMDDLSADTAGVFASVLRFLGLDDDPTVDLGKQNVGEQKRLRNFRLRAFLKRSPAAMWLLSQAPRSWRRRLGDAAERVTGERVDARAKLDPALRRELTEEFAPEVQRLERLLGRDLSAWRPQPETSGV